MKMRSREQKEVINVQTQNNEIIKEVKQYGGSPGDNLQLTINAEFQNQVQKIVEDNVKMLLVVIRIFQEAMPL